MRSCSSCRAIGFKLAEATNASCILRKRGEGGLRLACAVPALLFLFVEVLFWGEVGVEG